MGHLGHFDTDSKHEISGVNLALLGLIYVEEFKDRFGAELLKNSLPLNLRVCTVHLPEK